MAFEARGPGFKYQPRENEPRTTRCNSSLSLWIQVSGGSYGSKHLPVPVIIKDVRQLSGDQTHGGYVA